VSGLAFGSADGTQELGWREDDKIWSQGSERPAVGVVLFHKIEEVIIEGNEVGRLHGDGEIDVGLVLGIAGIGKYYRDGCLTGRNPGNGSEESRYYLVREGASLPPDFGARENLSQFVKSSVRDRQSNSAVFGKA